MGIERFEYNVDETQNSAEDDQDIGGNLAVYNPVDENYSSWNNENKTTTDNNDNDASSDDELSVEMVLPSTVDQSAIDEHIDINDPEVIESQRRQLSQIEASKKGSSGETTTSMDDDMLAQAIAEQDLPPGVNAVEQQEIMMRLLTQQLRRGDWDASDISPALEQRLRDFQFAQKKRREKFGNERPYGILGLYDHLGKMVCLVYDMSNWYCDINSDLFQSCYFLNQFSGDTTRCRMGRGCGLEAYTQGTISELVRFQQDTRPWLEPSILYIHSISCVHGGISC